MTILIIWILFGIVTAVAATNKGHNGFGWFCLGVLLGPFGFILALLLAKKPSEEERDLRAHGIVRDCPFCAETIKAAAVKCRFCGTELPVDTAQPLAEPSGDSRDWIDRLPPVQSPHNASH